MLAFPSGVKFGFQMAARFPIMKQWARSFMAEMTLRLSFHPHFSEPNHQRSPSLHTEITRTVPGGWQPTKISRSSSVDNATVNLTRVSSCPLPGRVHGKFCGGRKSCCSLWKAPGAKRDCDEVSARRRLQGEG